MRAGLCRSVMVTAIVLGSAAAGAAAPAGPVRAFLDVGFVSSGVDAAVARQEGIGTRGYGLLLGGGLRLHEIGILGLDGGIQFISDKDSFSESTTAGTLSSSTSIYDVSLYAGLRAPSLGLGSGGWRLTGGVNAGWSGFGGRRSIDNCVDCTEESLHVGGGVYAEPIVTLFNRQGVQLGLSYRIYGKDSDIRSGLLLRVGFRQ